MNKSNTSSATIIPKLQGILKDDLVVLRGMLNSRTEKSAMYGLIDSLIYAKRKILDLLPNSEGMDEVPTTLQKIDLKGYRVKNSTEIKDNNLLVGVLLEIEATQLRFVEEAVESDDIPSELQSVLKDINNIYLKIVEQLSRSKKTNQLGTLIV